MVIHGNIYFCIWCQLIRVVIATVTKNPTRIDHAVITIHQFHLHANIYVRYMLSFLSKERGVASLILRPHMPHYTNSNPPLYTCNFPLHGHPSMTPAVTLCWTPFPFQYWFSRSKVLGWYCTGAHDLKGVSPLCALTGREHPITCGEDSSTHTGKIFPPHFANKKM